MSDQALEKPAGAFRDYFERMASTAPETTDKAETAPYLQPYGPPKKWQLLLDGNPIGYLGMNSEEWCVVAPTIELALPLQRSMASFNNTFYYQVVGRDDRFLSVAYFSGYVGLYPWTRAADWHTYEYGREAMISAGDGWGAMVSIWDQQDNFVYARSNTPYKKLGVRFIGV
jgi:hypothetical protein